MEILNPANGALIATLPDTTTEQIQQKYTKARAAQLLWLQRALGERLDIIGKFYQLLADHQNKLAEVLTSEVGKPLNQAKGEINGARKRIKFFLDQSERYLANETMYEEEGLKEIITYEPLGVVGNISAWNYPYLVGVNVFVPALIAGNAVLYKPSEHATLTGLKIRDLLYEAGIPEEVFQVVVGGKEAGEAMLSLPLDGYFFTGSYRTGQYIYERVAPKMVPCQLELGGKDPLYVPNDVKDINNVAVNAAEGAFYNNGQSCCAVERIYVHEAIYDDFVAAFVKETQTYQVGQPTEDGVFIGPLTRKDQVKVLEGQVSDAVEKGATLLLGGKAIDNGGYYFEPTVLANVSHQMKVMTEESFGPIIGIQKVRNDEEAITLMKDTEYGLTAAVYCDSQKRAEGILKQMDTGTVYWNCCDRVSPYLPWSGRKHSGIGATLSHMGIRAFTRPKAYHLRG
jgi:acyl-CoA reductase-like NAD-dependent aldehyde dehydrogenase